MRIIGPPSADIDTVRANIPTTAHARFRASMFPHLWEMAWRYGIDPVGVVAQSFKETGGGNFGRAVTPLHFNTAGIKRVDIAGLADDDPNAHARFASWEVGAMAQCQHLGAYAGMPVDDLIVDPRFWLVKVTPATWCENFEDLAGRWAPSPTYGTELVAIARRLQGRA